MSIQLVNPKNQLALEPNQDFLVDAQGNTIPQINGIYRFAPQDNYTDNFGFQWNTFQTTQIDRHSHQDQSQERFFKVTAWDQVDLAGQNILEVGSGAGRFSQIVLDYTQANLYSVDYSNAVDANYQNNAHHGDRLKLFQASIYELPFAPRSFDRVFCFGVLQHTPNVKKSVACLAEMVKPGGELIVDFYPIRGWWTKIHAKYLFRPLTRKMSHKKLLSLIQQNSGWMIKTYQTFDKLGLGKLFNRFLPICDIKNTLPPDLSPQQLKEWVILDTFDMFSPEYDQPQRISTVKKWFEDLGMENIFADMVPYSHSHAVAAVKGYQKNN